VEASESEVVVGRICVQVSTLPAAMDASLQGRVLVRPDRSRTSAHVPPRTGDKCEANCAVDVASAPSAFKLKPMSPSVTMERLWAQGSTIDRTAPSVPIFSRMPSSTAALSASRWRRLLARLRALLDGDAGLGSSSESANNSATSSSAMSAVNTAGADLVATFSLWPPEIESDFHRASALYDDASSLALGDKPP